jgi:hypothetical protein
MVLFRHFDPTCRAPMGKCWNPRTATNSLILMEPSVWHLRWAEQRARTQISISAHETWTHSEVLAERRFDGANGHLSAQSSVD